MSVGHLALKLTPPPTITTACILATMAQLERRGARGSGRKAALSGDSSGNEGEAGESSGREDLQEEAGLGAVGECSGGGGGGGGGVGAIGDSSGCGGGGMGSSGYPDFIAIGHQSGSKPGEFLCLACDTWMSGLSMWWGHIETKKHRREFKKLRQKLNSKKESSEAARHQRLVG